MTAASGQRDRTRVRSRLQRAWRNEKLRYLATGAFNTMFGYLVFALLVLLVPQLHYTVALVLAYVVAVLVAYVIYRMFVFRVSGRFLRDLPKYVSVNLVTLALNLALLPLLVALGGVPVLLAQWLVVSVTAVIGYLGHKRFSFGKHVGAVPDRGSSGPP